MNFEVVPKEPYGTIQPWLKLGPTRNLMTCFALDVLKPLRQVLNNVRPRVEKSCNSAFGTPFPQFFIFTVRAFELTP